MFARPAPDGGPTPRRPDRPLDRVAYASPEVRVGAFRCPTDHPEFETAGPIEGYTIVFPRSAVWIQHDGRPPFVADPSVIAIYNLGQPYVRRPLSPAGDRADWFSLSRPLAVAIVRGIDPDAEVDPARPFPVAFGPATSGIYCRQRLLFTRLGRRPLDPFEIEQEVIMLVGAALEAALDRRAPGQCAPGTGDRESRDLVERARAELARDPFGRLTVQELADRLAVSPFHLCRLFRRRTGLTLYHYRLELRARAALERLESDHPGLSRLALELGFSSHSHFSAAFRRSVGMAPSRARRMLREAVGR